MKIFLNRDYFFNFVNQNKGTIIKVSVGLLVFTLAFFVFCLKDNGKADFELNRASESEINSEIAATDTVDTQSRKKIEENGELKRKNKEIFVDVSGAVVNPNVYKLRSGARVYEAIKKAGGFSENANAQNLNLAAKLKDQDKIVVQTEEELQKQNENMNIQFAENASITNASESMNSTEINEGRNFASGRADQMGQVNINSATKEELQTIKGVGPAMAGRILEYRRSNGGFSSVEDLKNVKGIGEKTFAKLRDSVRI